MTTRNQKFDAKEQNLLAFCEKGELEAIEYFFETTSLISPKMLNSGLITACRSYKVLGEHQEIIQLLINKGAEVNAVDSEMLMTPLMIASAKGLNQVVEVLIENNAKTDLKDKQGKTALIYSIENEHGENFEITSLLLSHMDNFNDLASGDNPPILFAVKRNLEKTCLLMVDKLPRLDVRDQTTGNSLLHYAVQNENEKLVKALMQKGVKNAKNFNKDNKQPSDLTLNGYIRQIIDEMSLDDKKVE